LRRVSWSRLVAVLLLLWGMCDLTVPGFCQTDFTDLETVATQMQASSNVDALPQHAVTSTQQDQKHAPLPADSDSDDCWCCCSHIVTTPSMVSLVSLDIVLDHPVLAHEEGPTWRVSEFFQPPKI
jgi:hypothetical protein